MRRTSDYISALNAKSIELGAGPMTSMIQKNSFSGIVSNALTKFLDRHTAYTDNSDYAYPDLVGPTTGLEVKVAINPSKGGESHNGHCGWHMIASFEIIEDRLVWTCVRFALLKGITQPDSDWKYSKSTVNSSGSQRTETYTTTSVGRTKFLEGIAYLDRSLVPGWSKWKRDKNYRIADWSIFNVV